MLNRFFIVLTITPSFLVRFRPVKRRIEALIMLFRTVRERSVQFSFWSSQRFGQTLVKLGQAWSNLVKTLQALGNVSRTTFRGFLGMVHPVLVGNGSVKPWSTSVKLGQTWSKLPKFWEMCPRPCSEVIWCDKPSSDQADLVRAASFCVSTPEKIPREKMGL